MALAASQPTEVFAGDGEGLLFSGSACPGELSRRKILWVHFGKEKYFFIRKELTQNQHLLLRNIPISKNLLNPEWHFTC